MPGIAIFIVSLGFNLLGDGLRDVLDPKAARMTRPCSTVEDLRVAFPSRAGPGRGGARRLFRAGPRTARHRRRIRLRQVADRPRHPGPDAAARHRRPPTGWNSTASTCATPTHAQWRDMRGERIAMVMQDPKFSLNPVMTIGRQIVGDLPRPPQGDRGRGARQGAGDAGGGADPRPRAGLSTPIRTRCPAAWASAR